MRFAFAATLAVVAAGAVAAISRSPLSAGPANEPAAAEDGTGKADAVNAWLEAMIAALSDLGLITDSPST